MQSENLSSRLHAQKRMGHQLLPVYRTREGLDNPQNIIPLSMFKLIAEEMRHEFGGLAEVWASC
jgi:hypothetical protein